MKDSVESKQFVEEWRDELDEQPVGKPLCVGCPVLVVDRSNS